MNIKEQFDEVISYSQNIQTPLTDRLFEIWEKKKSSFLNAFEGPIYEYPKKVAFELGDKEKHERVIQFAGLVYSKWGYLKLAQFIENQEEGFFDNITIEDAIGYDGKLIKKGTKLIKAFKHFVDAGDRSLADIQNEASRIIQEDKIEGTLCLSVHPLDFLSLSENTYNWRSCHSLDGEYRAGNLSYMMDECTFICYLKGADDVELPGFGPNVRWNSKKWRVLLYESKDKCMLMAGRQYPFTSSNGLDFILKEVLPKIGKGGSDWTRWNKTSYSTVELPDISIYLCENYIPVGTKLVPIKEIVEDIDGSQQYNDLLYSSCYKPWYSFKTKTYWGVKEPATTSYKTKFLIGEMAYCLRCGKVSITRGQNTMMCDECELEFGDENNEFVTTCECCGRRIFTDDTYRTEDGPICSECIRDYYIVCSNCGNYTHQDNIKYSTRSQSYLCETCFEEEMEEE